VDDSLVGLTIEKQECSNYACFRFYFSKVTIGRKTFPLEYTIDGCMYVTYRGAFINLPINMGLLLVRKFYLTVKSQGPSKISIKLGRHILAYDLQNSSTAVHYECHNLDTVMLVEAHLFEGSGNIMNNFRYLPWALSV